MSEVIANGGPPPETKDENPVLLDDDCLSCALDKYRPMIKEAFKMACV
jgi:hypothetical protein